MGRQYTFRTTRETAWLDDILLGIPDKDRARFIRDCIMRGLNGVPLEYKYVTQNEHTTQTEHKCNTNVTQKEDRATTFKSVIEVDEPTFEALDIDLDSKLNSLFD